MNTRRDVGLILAAELDNIAPTLDQMARPFARASEMTRRVELAHALADEIEEEQASRCVNQGPSHPCTGECSTVAAILDRFRTVLAGDE